MQNPYSKFKDFLDSYHYQLSSMYSVDEKIWTDFVLHSWREEVEDVVKELNLIVNLDKKEIQKILNDSGDDVYMDSAEEAYEWIVKLKTYLENNIGRAEKKDS